MMHRIALNFEDGVTRFIEARSDELVADAAYRAGLNIPLDCRDGACGTCKCRCESGDFILGSYIDDALTEEEAAERLVLTCQMKAKSDCVLRIPASSTICKVKVGSMSAEIDSVRQLSTSSIGFSLRLKDPDAIHYLPANTSTFPCRARRKPAHTPFRPCRATGSFNFWFATSPAD